MLTGARSTLAARKDLGSIIRCPCRCFRLNEVLLRARVKERVDGSLEFEGRASILDDNAQALSLALYVWTLRLSTYSTTGLLLQSGIL